MKSIAVLGLGIIGSVWARNLIADGFEVRAWNRTPQDFPGFVPDAAAAARGADIVFLVVADPAAVWQVLDHIESSLGAGQTLVQCSTISAEWTLRFAKRVQATGAHYLEAPFTGSKPAAQARQTVYYLGGEADLVQEVRPVLEHLSKAILHIGPIGSASTLKLAMNLNIATVSAALQEGLNLCRQHGIEDDTFFDALHQNVARSGVSDLKEPKLRAHDYTPQFSVKHMAKDLRLALETGEIASLPVTAAVSALYERGLQEGLGDDDFSGLMRLIDGTTPEEDPGSEEGDAQLL